MDKYKIISSGSHGNSVLIFDSIMVDCGVSYSAIKEYVSRLQLLTWSHKHSDHFNLETIKRIVFERPSLRIAVCEHEYDRAFSTGCKNIDILKHGLWYDYGAFKVATFKTYHDVPSNGYRFIKDDYKVFFATDTAFLTGITAKDYDLYALEHNYNEDTISAMIEKYPHKAGAINSHLSEQQAREWIYNNRKQTSEVVRLHESKSN